MSEVPSARSGTARAALGDFGERLAAHHLEAAGIRILERKVRVKAGEIDLIVRDGAEIAFVEVRTRRGPAGEAAASFTQAKLQRMWRCALQWCLAANVPDEQARLDAVVVELSGNGVVRNVEHFRGVGPRS